MTKRCAWVGEDPLYIDYHDSEWGVSEHDDRALFEKLVLDSFQAGLSWLIILSKRDKIEGTILNAQGYLQIVGDNGSFNRYLWQFTDGSIIQNRWRSMAEVPARTAESKAMSKALRESGFKFVGPTICYAFMQAVGMVNDHTTDCFRHKVLQSQ